MSKKLENKLALVTGASRGIGAAVAKAYAREGAHVILLSRTPGALMKVDDEIRETGGTATIMPCDLSNLDQVDLIGPNIAGRFGKLDIVVGNAAVLGDISPVALSDGDMWQHTMDINFHANVRLIRTTHPLLEKSPAGRAVFVTSAATKYIGPFWGPYGASKAALDVMVKTYAQETENTSIKVNLVDPGIVRTQMRATAKPGEDPMSLPHPDDITGVFVDLASDDTDNHGEIFKAA